jgi:hypothetical protein
MSAEAIMWTSRLPPQAFDQNEDTFKILQNLKIAYDAGFQAGLIYRPGQRGIPGRTRLRAIASMLSL